MLTLSPSLTAHQRSRSRRPSVLAYTTDTRFAAPVLQLASLGEPADTTAAPFRLDCDVDESADPFGIGSTLAVRNNAGALEYMAGFPGGSWSSLDTVTAGQGFDVKYWPAAPGYLVVYGDGNDLKYAHSSLPFFGTIVTEASPIGSVALALDDAGNGCVFYTLGTGTTLKRLRLTAGTWAGSGTNWSRSGSVATLTGLAAYWNGDYVLAVTGTAVTTTHRRLWAVAMGDTILPSNAWSGLVAIAEADAASGISFSYPSMCLVDSVPFCAFVQAEAGDVAYSRVFVANAMPATGPLGFWTEPAPTEFVDAYGAALAHWPNPDGYDPGNNDGHRRTALAASSQLMAASHTFPTGLSHRLIALKWKMTPDSFRLTAELENTDGAAGQEPDPDYLDRASTWLRLGTDLVIQHGYVSDGSTAEYGLQLRCLVRRIAHTIEPGRQRLIIEADGPWEALARFHATAAWTAPSGETRAEIFQRIAARAGLEVVAASGARAPSTAWTTDAPAFAIAANERGDTTLRRLLAPTPDFLRLSAAGGFELCGFSDSTYMEEYFIGGNNYDPDRHPLVSFTYADELEPNWLRLQGPDRYADAYYIDTDDRNPLGRGPWFLLLRDIDADDDTKASDRADAALKRVRQLTPTGQLVAPANVAQELFDIVRARTAIGFLSYRVIGLALEYKRSAASGAPGYSSTFDLADRSVFA